MNFNPRMKGMPEVYTWMRNRREGIPGAWGSNVYAIAPLLIAGGAMVAGGLIGGLMNKKDNSAQSYLAEAVQAIQNVKVPDPAQMKVNIDQLVQQGIITPEIAQVYMMNPTAFEQITTDPALMQAQLNALSSLEKIGQSGGMTDMDKAQVREIQDALSTTERGAREAILTNARERGVGGSGAELAAQLQNNQALADRASKEGIDVAAMAQQRALQAIQGAGTLGGQMQATQFGQKAQVASAQDAVNKFNTEIMNTSATNAANVRNAAAAANLSEKQRISEANVLNKYTADVRNADLIQRKYEDDLAKAKGLASAYSGQAQVAESNDAANYAGKQALYGGLVGIGGNMVTAGMGAKAAPTSTPSTTTAPTSSVPNSLTAETGYSTDIDPLTGKRRLMFNKGGKVDSPKNDTVPAMLSPGEIVVPKSAASNPHDLMSFVKDVYGKENKKSVKAKKAHPEDIANVLDALSIKRGK